MKLELELKEIDYILAVLQERPYKESAYIIRKIHEQVLTETENKNKK